MPPSECKPHAQRNPDLDRDYSTYRPMTRLDMHCLQGKTSPDVALEVSASRLASLENTLVL